MKKITSVNNEYIKFLSKLKDKKTRNQEQKFIVEGFHLVEEAYKANILLEVLTLDENINYKNIETTLVNKSIIEKLSTTKNPQEIIGICKINPIKEIEGNKFLLLDNINDPGNMGTLIRSSLGFGIDTIVISNDSVDVFNEKVIRASQGAIFNVNIVYADLLTVIEKLKAQSVKVIGTSLESSVDLKEVGKLEKYAIILGNEANGVKKEILNETDTNVRIKMDSKLESLNVAVAGSIIMYYLCE
jgi:TrmH family RNA methyltransferase